METLIFPKYVKKIPLYNIHIYFFKDHNLNMHYFGLIMILEEHAAIIPHRCVLSTHRKQLCPTLVVIMGNPASDKTITSAHGGQSQDSDAAPGTAVLDQGRGSGCSSSAPVIIGPVVRTICYVAAELVRLVSCVESMKPVLQSLYHRILLYPPPQHRVEAIKIMKEVTSSHTHSLFYLHIGLGDK